MARTSAPFISALLCAASCKASVHGDGSRPSPSPIAQSYAFVPPGQYSIGCDAALPCFSENKARTVVTRGFWINTFKTVSDEYDACSDAGRCSMDDAPRGGPANYIINAFLAGARDFCAWKGGRLPTNDEWEIAARGIGRRLYPWGNKFDAARLPRPEVIKAYDFEDWHYVRRGRDPASDSPFGVSEMSGGLYEFALDGEAVALRGAPIGDERDAEPLDYSAVRFSVAPPRAVAAFRCVYDQKPH